MHAGQVLMLLLKQQRLIKIKLQVQTSTDLLCKTERLMMYDQSVNKDTQRVLELFFYQDVKEKMSQ